MSGVAAVLAVTAVALQLVCAVFVVLADDALDRLHGVGPVSVYATTVTVMAVAISAETSSHIAKTIATGLVLVLASPFISRATARAIRIRRTGELRATDPELDAGRETS